MNDLLLFITLKLRLQVLVSFKLLKVLELSDLRNPFTPFHEALFLFSFSEFQQPYELLLQQEAFILLLEVFSFLPLLIFSFFLLLKLFFSAPLLELFVFINLLSLFSFFLLLKSFFTLLHVIYALKLK